MGFESKKHWATHSLAFKPSLIVNMLQNLQANSVKAKCFLCWFCVLWFLFFRVWVLVLN